MRSWQLSLVGIELRKLFAYRINFWVEFIGSSLGYFGIAYFVWSAVFAGAGQSVLGGYTFHMMLLYNLLVPIIGKATYAVDFSGIGDEIYTGSLNRYLIYPVSFFGFKFIQQMTTNAFVIFQLFLALGVFVFFLGAPPDFHFSILRMALFLGVLMFSMTLAFLISWTIQMVSFWADQVWSLMVSFRFLVHFLGGAWIPLALFPDSMAAVLRLSPFYLVVAFPAEIFLGKLALDQIWLPFAALLVWSFIIAAAGRYFWFKGLKVYSGVGI